MRERQEIFCRWEWAIRMQCILQSAEEKLNVNLGCALESANHQFQLQPKDCLHFDESRRVDLT
jgi:hypothetical protein